MADIFFKGIDRAGEFIWGVPAAVLFVGGGIFLSFALGWIQLTSLPKAFREIWRDLRGGKGEGGANISAVKALAASLGAVMGPGNIIGVSSAIIIGGPGAVFWMWMSAFLGMGAKYAESVLAVLHRRSGPEGNFGGPMYVMADRGFKKSAAVFAASGAVLSLTMANALPAGALGSALETSWGIPAVVTGAVLCVLAGLTVFGGIKRIGDIASAVVPIMSIFYILAAGYIIFANPGAALGALGKIFAGAFSLKAGVGGLLGGAIRYGLARGIYSNEAGMGTEPIMAAATSEESPHRQGLISMTGPFLDTIVFCSFTAVVTVMAGLGETDPAALVPAAFSMFLPGAGVFVVNVTLTLLVFATVTSWAFYGERCLGYFCGDRRLALAYRGAYALVPLFCAGLRLDILLGLTDLATAVMAFPNMIVCMLLVNEVRKCAPSGAHGRLPRESGGRPPIRRLTKRAKNCIIK